ncbi:transposase [Candidatus Woesearchaeota archaeon]|nr:transposase [Candidatus Woesearchaeota archaeon]
MKSNPTRYSSAVGEIWVMASFKVKYCHKIFDIAAVRELCLVLFYEAFSLYGVRWRKIAFDSDHVHMIIDMGLYSKIELAKNLRGFVAKQIFRLMPWLKYNKWEGGYFWGSGLWNPAYDIRSINNMAFYDRYLDKQKYSATNQKTLTAY